MADHHRAELVVDTLEMAAGRGALKEGCIAHSDRGSEYTSREYRRLIRELGLRQSLGRTGSCYDNTAAESFFGLLKAEFGTTVWESHEAVRASARSVTVCCPRSSGGFSSTGAPGRITSWASAGSSCGRAASPGQGSRET
ncbi:DDE-type integrase/transposase/recombinase [Streptomyces sp. CG1]|uniref:DDE-type integrase/transposase/recombinase n=1 Tax=Streptomyces sp. CG1 TaxID=1287523 RepID=UPI0034E2465D